MSRGSRFVVALICATQLFLFGIYLVSNYFTGRGFDESVLYHLRFGLTGAGYSEYAGLIFLTSLYLIAVMVSYYIIYRLLGEYGLPTYRFALAKPGTVPAQSMVAKVGTIASASAVLVLSLVVNPLTANVYAIIQTYDPDRYALGWTEDFELPVIPHIPEPKNILFIYLESFERTYLDESLFPNLAPNLRRLESQAISFTDVAQVHRSEWTIAGMVASQCGVPMFTPAAGNTMSLYDKFMPSAVCLGDFLSKNGYHLAYMGGAAKKFAGKERFYETHGFHSIEGRKDLIARIPNADYRSGWGLFDDSLFPLVAQKFFDLAKSEAPFALFVLTLDTHHPEGHISKSCKDDPYNDGANPMLNAVKCSDRLVSQFIENIRNSPHAQDTLIVVASDHLAMRNAATDLLQRGDRKNLFFVLTTSHPKRLQVTRPASILDVAPTVLSLMSMDIGSLGYGRDLLGEEQTLRERLPGRYDEFLRAAGDELRSSLWSYPSIGASVTFDLQLREIVLGERRIGFPVLLLLGDVGEIDDIKFAYNSQADDAVELNRLVENLDHGQAFLWADDCALQPVADINGYADMRGDLPRLWCVTYGRRGDATTSLLHVNSNNTLSAARILGLDSATARSVHGSSAVARGQLLGTNHAPPPY